MTEASSKSEAKKLTDAHTKIGTNPKGWKEKEIKFDPYTVSYVLDSDITVEKDLAPMLDDEVKEALEKRHGIDVKSAKVKQFKVKSRATGTSKDNPLFSDKAGVDPVFDAFYLVEKHFVLINGMYRYNDATTDKKKRLPGFELMVQGAIKLGMDEGPFLILRNKIINPESSDLIDKAGAELEGEMKGQEGIVVKSTSSGNSKEWYNILLGCDNGRAAGQAPNAHPTNFKGGFPTSIEIFHESWAKALLFVISTAKVE